MPRELVSFSTSDFSGFAKAVRRELSVRQGAVAGHVEMLNVLARAGGYRNFQHLRAEEGRRKAGRDADIVTHPDVVRALRFFDSEGQLVQWPARTSLQNLCLWVIWARIPAGMTFTEREISAHLNTMHRFGDAATVRRTLCSLGRVYCRNEVEPDEVGRALIGYFGVEGFYDDHPGGG